MITIAEKFELFDKQLIQHKKEITEYINNGTQPVKDLCFWLLTTQHNPHDIIMSKNAALLLSNAEGMVTLFQSIYYAFEGNCDICFIISNDGKPSILFSDSNNQDQIYRSLRAMGFNIADYVKFGKFRFIDTVAEFIEKFEIYALEHLRKHC